MRAMLQIDAEDEVKMVSSVLLLLSWLWPPLASARVIRGELDSRESWVYPTSIFRCFTYFFEAIEATRLPARACRLL